MAERAQQTPQESSTGRPLDLLEHAPESLRLALLSRGESQTHANKVLRRFYAAFGAPEWGHLPISENLRSWLRESVAPLPTYVAERVESADGTVKLLVGLAGGGAVEAVMMPSFREGEASCCISTQLGCAMGCDFCASTRGGLQRNLTAGEMVGQFLLVGAEAVRAQRALKRLVFMGTGEPLHNLDNVVAAIERMARPEMGALGWRRITVSTVGIVPQILRLADHDLGVHLAVSLHAPDDETRARIIPTARKYAVADILAAARDYQARTKRVVTLTYTLLAGVNDRDAQADLLGERLKGFRAHVNVIPYNPTGPGLTGASYRRPEADVVQRFLGRLQAAGVVAHARDVRGDDVAAACGQLRERALLG